MINWDDQVNERLETILTSNGWMRLWMAVSVVWVGFWAVVVIGAIWEGYYSLIELIQVALLAVAIPIALMIAGRVIRWVIRGFIS